uniref:Uncharacterized protein n=1 Tax=Papilio xuthus TaxID=66420 RepID=I4DLQ3_PAPXU|nr:unknown unsecreted protein [Papilio xuthus]
MLFNIFYSCERILRCDVYFSSNYYIIRSLTVVFLTYLQLRLHELNAMNKLYNINYG